MGIYANYPAAAFPLTGTEKIPASTELANGRQPQDEAVTVDQLKGYSRANVALVDAASIVSDASVLNNALGTVTLAGNRTLANPSNLQPGQRWDIAVTQDATGSRTLAYGNAYKKVGGAVTLTTTAGAVDVLHFVTDGTTVYVTIDHAFA
jgi:hypothetical protein